MERTKIFRAGGKDYSYDDGYKWFEEDRIMDTCFIGSMAQKSYGGIKIRPDIEVKELILDSLGQERFLPRLIVGNIAVGSSNLEEITELHEGALKFRIKPRKYSASEPIEEVYI